MSKTYQDLLPGTVVNNNELCELFKCSPQGGMRRAKKTNTLVIVSNHVESIYEDKWVGDVLHYTGMGRKGDQKLNTQNKTLAESNTNGISVHLFEVFKDTKYLYQGQVKLVEKPYQQEQPDEDGNNRTVWVFPVRLQSDHSSVSLEQIELASKTKQRKLRKKSIEQLVKDAEASAQVDVGYRNTQTKYYIRSDSVSQLAKKLAQGICQLCEQPAPFLDKNKEPYLETHHIEWLANGGADTPENTVALCPNCHKKMHIVNSDQDKLILINKNKLLYLKTPG